MSWKVARNVKSIKATLKANLDKPWMTYEIIRRYMNFTRLSCFIKKNWDSKKRSYSSDGKSCKITILKQVEPPIFGFYKFKKQEWKKQGIIARGDGFVMYERKWITDVKEYIRIQDRLNSFPLLLTYQPKGELFTNFSWTRVPSYKYKGEFLYTLKGRMKGEEVECHRVGKTRNWITNMKDKDLNAFLDYAKTQLVK
jgi:hypothetical protein